MLVKKQKMSGSRSCTGVCLAAANSTIFHRAGIKIPAWVKRYGHKATYRRYLRPVHGPVSILPPYRHFGTVLKMFMRVRAWTAGRRAGSHALWESDVTPGLRGTPDFTYKINIYDQYTCLFCV